MKKVVGILSVAIAMLMLWSLLGSDESGVAESATSSGSGNKRTALLDEVVFTREKARGQMTELVASGSHQVTGLAVTDVTTFRRIRSSSKIAYDTTYGSSSELTLNVVGPEFADGSLNPFHVREIREAVNWLIDRQYIVDEIYGGLAVPRFMPLYTAFPDSARLAETVRQLEVKYRPDPDRANRVITEELEALGAEKVDGQWRYQGEPITLRVLIRIEDQRRLIGDYVADLFHDLGFDVERLYRSAGEASRLWLAGDPAAGEWNIYTGGWVSPFVNRDLANVFNYYYTPRGRPSGLWQAYEPVPEFDEITDRLARRSYTSWEERQSLMRRALELSLEDSVRVWVTDQVSAWARSPDISMAVDLAGGVPSSSLWPFTLRYNEQAGGRMRIALPELLADPFNPIAGTNWTFDLMIIRGLRDSPVLPDPFTGLFMPQQIDSAEVIVRDDLVVNSTLDWVDLKRVEEITVPPDAWIDWDSEAGQWITVGEKYPDGLTSETLVRITYPDDFLERRWHDGSPRSVADIVLQWILTFERADESSPMFDTALVPAFTLFEKSFHGRRIVSTDPLVIESYGGPVFPDAETLVATRSPGFRGTSGISDMHVPWHTLALAIRAETQGDLALSSNKADKDGVEWTNFVDGPTMEILGRHLGQARETDYLPYENVLAPFMAPGEIESRYAALGDWFDERGHFWVGDGPYYLHAVHAVEGSVVLRPSPEYEEPADRWLRFSEPRIPAFDIAGPMIVPLDQPATFEVDVQFKGKPYPVDDIETVSYMVFNSQGGMATSGEAELTDSGRWRIAFDNADIEALGIGGNRLEIAVTAKPVAMPAFGTHGFATVPGEDRSSTVAATETD